MKRTLIGLITATALTSVIPAVASAQTINERQAALFARIDGGVQARQLTPSEASNLKAEFNAIARLEADFRASAPGLTDAERGDLNRRFDALSARIRFDRNDNDRVANWQPINARQSNLFDRIDRGVRNGGLTRAEADRLKQEFFAIAQMEERYRRDGLTRNEASDLDNRLDILARQIRDERRDGQQAGRVNLSERLASLGAAIERAARNGWINNRETRDLRARHAEMARLDVRYRTDGYNRAERDDMSRRLENLEYRLESDAGRQFGSLDQGYTDYSYNRPYGYSGYAR